MIDDAPDETWPRDEPPESRWTTIETSLSAEQVRAAIHRALRPHQPLAYGVVRGGQESRDGFLLRLIVDGRPAFGEVQVAGWQDGTQLQVVVAAEDRDHREVIVAWVRDALAAG